MFCGIKNCLRLSIIILLLFLIILSAKTRVIESVIDGDTFRLIGGEKVRLLGIDVPEKGQPGYDLAKWFLFYFTLKNHLL